MNLIVCHLGTARGGISRVIDNWLSYDMNRHYDPELICRDLQDIFSGLARLQLPVRRFPLANSRLLRYLDFRIVRYLVTQIRSLPDPVLNPHDPFANLHCVTARVLAGRRCRLISTVHTTSWKLPTDPAKRSALFFLEKTLLRQTDHILTVSGYVRKELMKFGIPGEKITVVRNGIEPIERLPNDEEKRRCAAELGTDRSVRVLGFAGRLSPEKGFDNLLTALTLLPRKVTEGLRVLVAGDSPDIETITSRVRQAGLERQVHFLGFLRNMGTFYSALDALVLPSKIEGLPMVALEAMNYGVPVVATRAGGTPEVVTDGTTGWLVRTEDPFALAGALSQACSNPSELLRRGKEGRARVLEDFTLERMINSTEVILSRFASQC